MRKILAYGTAIYLYFIIVHREAVKRYYYLHLLLI